MKRFTITGALLLSLLATAAARADWSVSEPATHDNTRPVATYGSTTMSLSHGHEAGHCEGCHSLGCQCDSVWDGFCAGRRGLFSGWGCGSTRACAPCRDTPAFALPTIAWPKWRRPACLDTCDCAEPCGGFCLPAIRLPKLRLPKLNRCAIGRGGLFGRGCDGCCESGCACGGEFGDASYHDMPSATPLEGADELLPDTPDMPEDLPPAPTIEAASRPWIGGSLLGRLSIFGDR